MFHPVRGLQGIAQQLQSGGPGRVLLPQELQSNLEREISTVDIGEMVMNRLKDVDEVAYVRFASVYRSFKDINTFMEELTKLLGDRK